MPGELTVHVSRRALHELELPDSFEAAEPFDVLLVNHGEPLHVHLHLDDALSEVAAVAAGNHYVESESRRAVRVDVDTDRLPEDGVRGKLKVASAYGARTRWVDVALYPPESDPGAVEVDESLARPQPREEPEADSPVVPPEWPVLGLGTAAIAVAVVAAALFRDATVLVGSLTVIVGVAVALFVLFR